MEHVQKHARLVRADDIADGLYVTISRIVIDLSEPDALGISQVGAVRHALTMAPPGSPLLVIAVDLPYVALEPVLRKGQVFVLDCRAVELRSVSPEFVQRLTASKGGADPPDAAY